MFAQLRSYLPSHAVPPPLAVVARSRRGEPFTAAEASREFAAWLRGLSPEREHYSDRQMAARYQEFCDLNDDRLPAPENMVRAALVKRAGIKRETRNTRGRTGKRRRAVVWTVTPAKRKANA